MTVKLICDLISQVARVYMNMLSFYFSVQIDIKTVSFIFEGIFRDDFVMLYDISYRC